MWSIRMLILGVLLTGCAGGDKSHDSATTALPFHPEGWASSARHGWAAKFQEQDCTACHGEDLTGGSSEVGCDYCHPVGWRSDCTFCHGGVDNSSGAPPHDIDGQDSDLSFAEHTSHVEPTNHPAWTCEECHHTPIDVLSEGHIFVGDSSAGVAELDFSAGLSFEGSYAGGGACSDLYCHGDGTSANGTVSSGAALDCAGCHGGVNNPETLSTVHEAHLDSETGCADCHADTVLDDETVSEPDLHVNGAIDLAFPSGMVETDGSCTGTCHEVEHTNATWTDGGFHPEDFEAPDQHGMEAKLQLQDCTTCHGADLDGGISSTSCDSCHTADWRTDCTYCHGGTDNETGAPPDDIHSSDTNANFDEHSIHVEEQDHPAWDCEQCHATPTDVMTEGHLFVGDDSPGVAEVSFAAGLSPDGIYAGAGSCSDLYCHGDGASTLGTANTGETTACGSCHGSDTAPGTLSIPHAAHFDEAVTCEECHGDTATNSDTIADPTFHVNGAVDFSFDSGMVYDGSTCLGTCHDVYHGDSTWAEDGFHETGWEDADIHGLAAKLQDQACTTCHGSDLTGGTSGADCDSCHTADWRTDCTYCHGGADNGTGAPPDFIDGSSTTLSFDEHTLHVEENDHPAYDCDQCHTKPTDVLSSGHIFVGDTTAAVSEVTFAAGLSTAGTYAGAGVCSNLYCHGDGNGTLGSKTTGTTVSCTSCHGGKGSSGSMSGHHSKHLGNEVNANCADCHGDTVSNNITIDDPTLHVNGSADTAFSSGMSWDGTFCTGSCHAEDHENKRW